MQLAAASQSHIGLAREINQDALLMAAGAGVFVVADGMGGEKAGEEASAQVVATLQSMVVPFTTQAPQGPEALHQVMNEALLQANQDVVAIGRREPAKRGLGSTATLLVLYRGLALVGHVGDSRLYRVRGGSLQQLTRDHSVVWQLYERGVIGRADLETHPERHLLTQCVGDPRSIQVEMLQERVEAGDVFLLCSDGLTGYAPETVIAQVMSDRDMTLEGKAARLIEVALQGGGGDNVTVLLVRVERLEASDDWQALPDYGRTLTPQDATGTGALAETRKLEDPRAAALRGIQAAQRRIMVAVALLVLMCGLMGWLYWRMK